MSQFQPPSSNGQGFIEYALIIILFAIVFLSIILIFGNDLRDVISDIGIFGFGS